MALANKANESSRMDFDFLLNSKDGLEKYHIGPVRTQGKKTNVPILIWHDAWSVNLEPDMVKKRAMARPAMIHLIDVGSGPQIFDIHFVKRIPQPDGSIKWGEGTWIRETLVKSAKTH